MSIVIKGWQKRSVQEFSLTVDSDVTGRSCKVFKIENKVDCDFQREI